MVTENKLIVEFKTIMLPEIHEKFEDKLRDFLEKEGIEGCITNEENEEEAIDILRHLSIVNRLWKQKVSYETITQIHEI